MLGRHRRFAPFPTLGNVEDHLESLKDHLTGAYQRLEDSKRLGVAVSSTRRFFEIDGLDLAGLLATFGIDPAGIGIILGVDRILDMCRTATNVGCDVTTAVVVDALVKKEEARAAGVSSAPAA